MYIDGNLIESKKVKKAISRYGSMSATTEMQLQGNRIRLISTSDPHHEDSAIAANA